MENSSTHIGQLMDAYLESYLLKQYMQEYIDTRRPVTLEFQLKVWKKHGFIHEGYTDSNFMSFDTWKRIREMHPKDPIKELADAFGVCSQVLNEPIVENLILIPRRDLPLDIFSRTFARNAAKNIDREILGL